MKQLKFCLFFLIASLSTVVFVQESEKDDLIRKKREIEKEIELTNKLIEETRNKQKYSIQELKLVGNNLKRRNILIQQLKNEIVIIDNSISESYTKLRSYTNELEKTKKEYAGLIYYAFKNRDTNLNFMYLLAANDINQFYNRYIYLKQYKEYRIKNMQLIIKLKAIIEIKIAELEKKKINKLNLINLIKTEKATLLREQEDINNIVFVLKQKESDLLKQVDEKRKVAEKLEREIENLIKKEVKKNKYESLTPEDKIISNEFSTNKGRLPWPTEQGVITDQFGEHDHPVMKSIKVRNNGVDISTVMSAKARAIFNGDVSKVFTIKGANTTVIIRHGNYYTVYHNLKNVKVHPGDKVITKQNIGEVYTNAKTGETVIHFELWKELEKQNPEDWLSN
jgi:septal ring factor EnvC (AmiA/AmiB activator)